MSPFPERKFDLCPPHYNQPLYFLPPYPPHNNRESPPPRDVLHRTEHFDEGGHQNKDYEYGDIGFIAIVASLCIVFIIIVAVCYVYVRRCARLRQLDDRPTPRARISQARRFSWRVAEDYSFTSARDGLRRSMVDALPVFVYKPESFKDGLRCAVCLCEFQENEKARMLPSCNHSFHVDCIDLWFNSHSTCPLCRASVEAQSEQSVLELGHRQMEVSVIGEEGGGDEKSGSATTEQHEECLNQNNDEGSGADAAIDIPTMEK